MRARLYPQIQNPIQTRYALNRASPTMTCEATALAIAFRGRVHAAMRSSTLNWPSTCTTGQPRPSVARLSKVDGDERINREHEYGHEELRQHTGQRGVAKAQVHPIRRGQSPGQKCQPDHQHNEYVRIDYTCYQAIHRQIVGPRPRDWLP